MGRRSKRKKLLLKRHRLLGIELDPQEARRVGLGHIIGEQERIKDLAVANLDKEAREYQAQLQSASQGGQAVGSLIGTLGSAALQFGFGKVF